MRACSRPTTQTALNLQPLGRREARRLVDELLHVDEVGDEARTRILERAEGNPFFVEEILRMLIDRGALERRERGWTASTNLVEIPLPGARARRNSRSEERRVGKEWRDRVSREVEN